MQFFLTPGADPVNIFGELAGSEASGHRAARWHRPWPWPSFSALPVETHLTARKRKRKAPFSYLAAMQSKGGTLDNLRRTTADWILRSLSGVTEVRVAEEAITAGL